MAHSVTFLFGAGCEGEKQFDLPSGLVFKRETILAKGAADLANKLNSFDGNRIKNGAIINRNSTSVLYQTIKENNYADFGFKNSECKTIKKYLELKGNGELYKNREQINKNFSRLYKSLYNRIEKGKIDGDRPVEEFLKRACFFSFVDSQFNYLRKPELYVEKTNIVMKLYYSAFKSVAEKIIDGYDAADNYNDFIRKDIDVLTTRSELARLLSESQKRAVDYVANNKNSGCKEKTYYELVKEFKETFESKDDKNKVGVITTNYTNFSQKIIGLDDEEISYVHGRLDLFENVKTKRIAKLEDFDVDEIIFPFIFIQSGIKPIVSGYQIHELEKSVNMIEQSDSVVILGYGINSDDEHITNLLRERIRCGKNITVAIYDVTGSEKEIEEEKERICIELKCPEEELRRAVKFILCSGFKEYLEDLGKES